mgnify:CR=1 FL=1
MNEDRFSWIETWKDRSAEFVDWAYDRLSQLWRVAEQAFDWVRRRPWAMRTLIVLSSLAASTFFAALFRPLISPESEFMLYLPAVAVSGLFAGVPAGFAASIAGAWLAMYMFIFPYRDALTNRGQETAALLLYLMASALILLLNRVQEAQKQQIREFAETLTAELPIPVETYDERLTTRLAAGSSRAGARGAPDSLAAWGFFDAVFEQKEYAEGYILEDLARGMLAADPNLAREYEARLASDRAFRESPEARLDFFYQRSPYRDTQIGAYPVVRVTTPLPRR